MAKRVLIFDIEVSLAEAYLFRTGYGINVGWHQIKKESQIICISYKFEGQKTVHCLDWGKKRCDKELLKKFVKIANQADELVGHNSDKFDIKWIRTRCFFHRLPMMPEYTSVDTYKDAKKYFYYQSNGLDYINRFGGGTGKTKTDYDLWKRTTEGEAKALREMKKYCKVDVLKAEETYLRMRPYVKHKSSVASYKCDCPRCGSDNVKLRSNKMSGAGVRYKQMQCQQGGCGTYFKLTETGYATATKKKKADIKAAKKK